MGWSQPLGAQSMEMDHRTDNTQPAQDHLQLGIDFYLTDSLDSAIQEFREAKQLWPEYANAHWNLGVGLAKLGDLEGAVSAWAQAERLDPSAIPVHVNLSALAAYNYGVALLQRGNLSQAITEWEQALRIQPDLAEAYYALGQIYSIKGKTILSQQYLEHAVHWAADWPEALNQLGVAFYHNGDDANARHYLDQAIRLKPEDARAYTNLGLVQWAEGHPTEAEQAFTTAISLDPTLPQAHFNLGVLYAQKQDWPRAVAQLHTTIHLKPQFADAHALLGSALSSTGNWPRAIKEWHMALALNPQAPYAHEIFYNIGMGHRVTNANVKAINAFQRAAQRHPHSAQTQLQLAFTYEAMNDWGKASDHYLLAIQYQPDWALPYFKLGLVRYQQGFLDAAIESHQRAITLYPEYTDAHYQLGVTLRAANQPQASLTHIRLAAEQGMREAQELLGTMFANGSGTERDLVQAMRWWFQSAYAPPDIDGSETARTQLSRLRTWAFSHREHSDDIQQVAAGFKAIQTDIRKRFHHNDPSFNTNSVGVLMAQSGNRDKATPILLQEAFALNPEAHDYLAYLFKHDDITMYRSRILDYFWQTASEGSAASCQLLKTLSPQRVSLAVEFTQPTPEACPQ